MAEHKTLAGMLCLDSCLEGRGYRSLHSLVCQHQDLEFDMSDRGQLDAYINSVHVCVLVCMCTSCPNWLIALLMTGVPPFL